MLRYSIIFLLLTSCASAGIITPALKDYTPEQLEQLKDLGWDAVRCGTLSGPPPYGTVSTITIPKNRKVKVEFAGCTVKSIEVGDEINKNPTP